MIGKKLLYWLFVYTNKSNQLFFAVSIKFCDELGLAILSKAYIYIIWSYFTICDIKTDKQTDEQVQTS